jgi:hypothetical protein
MIQRLGAEALGQLASLVVAIARHPRVQDLLPLDEHGRAINDFSLLGPPCGPGMTRRAATSSTRLVIWADPSRMPADEVALALRRGLNAIEGLAARHGHPITASCDRSCHTDALGSVVSTGSITAVLSARPLSPYEFNLVIRDIQLSLLGR